MSGMSEALGLQGVECVAVVGCGGKTSLVQRLAQENATRGVLIAPTAKMAVAEVEACCTAACGEQACTGVTDRGVSAFGKIVADKLTAMPLEEIQRKAQGYALTLMEADGSKGLPLKGWTPDEPVVPGFATLTVGVVSARAVGLAATAGQVHRLPYFLAQTGLLEGQRVTEETVARMIQQCMEQHGLGRRVIVINQVEDQATHRAAMGIVKALAGFAGDLFLGSFREGSICRVI